jgi:hypothetical protein
MEEELGESDLDLSRSATGATGWNAKAQIGGNWWYRLKLSQAMV